MNKKNVSSNIVAQNRKASFNYFFLELFVNNSNIDFFLVTLVLYSIFLL